MEKQNVSEDCKKYYSKEDKTGRKNLTKSFLDQDLLDGVEDSGRIAETFADLSEVEGYIYDQEVYQQGTSGNYIYFVLKGSCSLFVRDNFVTEIPKGQCFGEYPILDPGLDYSVTIHSNVEKTCIARLPAGEFDEIAKNNPEIWRNMAKMLAMRLKLSTEDKYKKRPNPRPKIFIGSSKEELDVARLIHSELYKYNFDPVVWDEIGIFESGRSTLESLESIVEKYDFGVFVFTGDDELMSRGESEKISRDNVIFELGMFIGRLSRFKTFLIHSRDKQLRILSDLKGINMFSFDDSDESTLKVSVTSVCYQIKELINSILRINRQKRDVAG